MSNEIAGQRIDPHQRLKRPAYSYSREVNYRKKCLARAAHIYRHSGGQLIVRNWSNGQYLEKGKEPSVTVPDGCLIENATERLPQKAAVLLHEAGNAIISPECFECPLATSCANARRANQLINGPLKQGQVDYLLTVTGMDLTGFPDPDVNNTQSYNPNSEQPGLRPSDPTSEDWTQGYSGL